jgi:hypothetical protein
MVDALVAGEMSSIVAIVAGRSVSKKEEPVP